MGSVRKASAWLGLVDDNDDERYDDDDYAEGQESGEAWVTDPRVKVASETAAASRAPSPCATDAVRIPRNGHGPAVRRHPSAGARSA